MTFWPMIVLELDCSIRLRLCLVLKLIMKVVLLFGLCFLCTSVSAQTYVFNDARSSITFEIRNFGVAVSGEFHGLQGLFVLDQANVPASHFHASVDVASISTGIGLRDRHLLQENYFDYKEFPAISIESKYISKNSVRWVAEAIITIKNVSKTISFEFDPHITGGECKVSASFVLNRLDFGVGSQSFSLSDEVLVRMNVVGTTPSQQKQ